MEIPDRTWINCILSIKSYSSEGVNNTQCLQTRIFLVLSVIKAESERARQTLFNTGTPGFRATKKRNQNLYVLFPSALKSSPDGKHVIAACQKCIKDCFGF